MARVEFWFEGPGGPDARLTVWVERKSPNVSIDRARIVYSNGQDYDEAVFVFGFDAAMLLADRRQGDG